MREKLVLTGLGIAVWGIATLFFRVFGAWLLVEPTEKNFGSSLFLLALLTLLVLIGLALFIRLRLFPDRGSATRFGFTAAVVGLLLDTPVIWYREGMFPKFTEGQHHSFTIWMTFAYALTLLVPYAVDRLIRQKAEQPDEMPPDEEEVVDVDADRTT